MYTNLPVTLCSHLIHLHTVAVAGSRDAGEGWGSVRSHVLVRHHIEVLLKWGLLVTMEIHQLFLLVNPNLTIHTNQVHTTHTHVHKYT